MEKLRVAVIGCGSIHRMHTTAITILNQSDLVAVCDINEEKAATTGNYYSVPYYTDYKELISSEKIDVVHICTPHFLHTTIAQYSLSHGIHVLSEKPMAIEYEDAKSTVELAERMKLNYGVIFQCRYNDASVFVKNKLEDGSLGKIQGARAVLTWNRSKEYYANSDWKGTIDKEGGGVIIDQAIHSLDLITWFINSELRSIEATITNHAHDYINVEDTAEGFLVFKDGTKAMFWATNCYTYDEPVEIRLFCENGTVILTYDDARITYNNGQVVSITQRNATVGDYLGGKQCWGLSHKIQIEQFYNSIINGIEPEISGRQALKTQFLINEIYRSSKNHIRIIF